MASTPDDPAQSGVYDGASFHDPTPAPEGEPTFVFTADWSKDWGSSFNITVVDEPFVEDHAVLFGALDKMAQQYFMNLSNNGKRERVVGTILQCHPAIHTAVLRSRDPLGDCLLMTTRENRDRFNAAPRAFRRAWGNALKRYVRRHQPAVDTSLDWSSPWNNRRDRAR